MKKLCSLFIMSIGLLSGVTDKSVAAAIPNPRNGDFRSTLQPVMTAIEQTLQTAMQQELHQLRGVGETVNLLANAAAQHTPTLISHLHEIGISQQQQVQYPIHGPQGVIAWFFQLSESEVIACTDFVEALVQSGDEHTVGFRGFAAIYGRNHKAFSTDVLTCALDRAQEIAFEINAGDIMQRTYNLVRFIYESAPEDPGSLDIVTKYFSKMFEQNKRCAAGAIGRNFHVFYDCFTHLLHLHERQEERRLSQVLLQDLEQDLATTAAADVPDQFSSVQTEERARRQQIYAQYVAEHTVSLSHIERMLTYVKLFQDAYKNGYTVTLMSGHQAQSIFDEKAALTSKQPHQRMTLEERAARGGDVLSDLTITVCMEDLANQYQSTRIKKNSMANLRTYKRILAPQYHAELQRAEQQAREAEELEKMRRAEEKKRAEIALEEANEKEALYYTNPNYHKYRTVALLMRRNELISPNQHRKAPEDGADGREEVRALTKQLMHHPMQVPDQYKALLNDQRWSLVNRTVC